MFSKVERIWHINMNLDKCAFMVFLGMILGFIVFKKRKLPNPKKIQAIVNIHHPRIHNRFKYLMGWHNFIEPLSKNLLLLQHLK